MMRSAVPVLPLLLSVLLAAGLPVRACGLEDPGTLAIGALNFAYPDALHVGTAVWQAQQENLLPRPLPWADTAQARQAQAWEVLRLLDGLARAWPQKSPADAPLPPLAVVFIGTAMWSRLIERDGKQALLPHVGGPEPGDLVLVSEPAVLQAWIEGRLDGATMLRRGLTRLYGEPAAQAAVRSVLESGPVAGAAR